MSTLKTRRPPKRCFPWKCGRQGGPEFTQLPTPRSPARHCRLACYSKTRHKHTRNRTTHSCSRMLTHIIMQTLSITWWALRELSRNTHTSLGICLYSDFLFKWRCSVKWLRRRSSWNVSVAFIKSMKWKQTGQEIKSQIWRTKGG